MVIRILSTFILLDKKPRWNERNED